MSGVADASSVLKSADRSTWHSRMSSVGCGGQALAAQFPNQDTPESDSLDDTVIELEIVGDMMSPRAIRQVTGPTVMRSAAPCLSHR